MFSSVSQTSFIPELLSLSKDFQNDKCLGSCSRESQGCAWPWLGGHSHVLETEFLPLLGGLVPLCLPLLARTLSPPPARINLVNFLTLHVALTS